MYYKKQENNVNEDNESLFGSKRATYSFQRKRRGLIQNLYNYLLIRSAVLPTFGPL